MSVSFAVMKLAGAGTLATALLLAGCATGPAYVRPSVEVPGAFKERAATAAAPAPQPGWKPAAPHDAQDRGAWWEIFQDESLNQLEARVAVSNQTIVKAVASLEQARAVVGQARAAYYPTIQAGIEPDRTRTSATVIGRQGLAGRTVWDNTAALNASWEPDVFGKVSHAVAGAKAREQASAADLASVELSMHAELAVDYFDLRGVDTQSDLLRQTVVAFQAALDIATQRFNAGVASDSDVAFAQTQVQTARAQFIDLGVMRAQLEHAIATLIGEPASTFVLPPNATQLAPPEIPAGVPSQLLERRPDVAAAERLMAASNADVGSATAAFFPDLMLSLTGGLESGGFSQWASAPSRFWAVGLPLVGTLFDGGLRKQKLNAAKATYDSAVADYRQVVLTSFQEVEDNLAALRVLAEESGTQQLAVSAAQHELDLALQRYQGGAVGYLEVVTAQSAALTNERTAIDIARRRLDASVLLVKALGGLWDTT
ncbi:MAG TPA: efflux transporter outer membrane subunit [Steroidobacteraceae bacterium]|nr:efflux transporter outer membrane subunit [Steroidobacteraceae bacterium]